ncbi:hypothetical protein ALQ62_01753 [Pseudomonas coronafaciens pv. zizaniae]|uniref:SMEK domain-containing protein n=1 Tax=Pseudomonas coronafaciens TaxID=53409 RepID=UPI000EFDDE5A|nr:SMEK domain-containing protein [Pseudomonas coronafaciens]RMN27234.1 hypothetical protein ALQ62_01753 [Pseudomonas coronafaciens pv. zizaniae]
MLTDRARDFEVVTHTLTTYAFNVWSLAQNSLFDEAKAAEDALISIVNIAYNSQFKNLNHLQKNYPGIDWRVDQNGPGLQVTTTKTWQKITSTIDAVIANRVDTSKNVWFLFIYPGEYRPVKPEYKNYSITTITINDLIRQISALSDSELSRAKNEIITKLRAWIPPLHIAQPSSYIEPSYRLPVIQPEKFITLHNLWHSLDNRDEVPPAVFMQLKIFIASYAKLPQLARSVIAKIVQHSSDPKGLNWPIEIKLQNLQHFLTLEEQENSDSIFEIITSHGLGCMTPKDHEFIEGYEEPTITYYYYFELNWRACEPDYNVCTALKSYYKYYFSERDLFHAFEFADFSLVE